MAKIRYNHIIAKNIKKSRAFRKFALMKNENLIIA